MPKKTAAKKATTRKTASTPNGMSKAAFVRSLPASTPAKEVVAKAAEKRIKLTEAYVYNVRATTKAAKKSKRATVAPTTTTTTTTTKNNTVRSTSNETAFRKLVLDLGIARSKTLLADVERGIAAVIAGR
jgi:hypothetical protein